MTDRNPLIAHTMLVVVGLLTLVLVLTTRPAPVNVGRDAYLPPPAPTGAPAATDQPWSQRPSSGVDGASVPPRPTASPSPLPKPTKVARSTPRPTARPKPAPTRRPAVIRRTVGPTVGGTATWYCVPGRSPCTVGYPASGFYAAAGPELRVMLGDWRGRSVLVCAGRCITVRLIDWCSCPGDHVIDLYGVAMVALVGRASPNSPVPARGGVDVVIRAT